MSIFEKHKLIVFSFLMSVLVILVHSVNNESFFESFIVQNICQYAIPSFFIMSGFLFFRTASNIKVVFDKILKRAYTLLIPYLMWNVIYYLMNVIFKKEVYFSMNNLVNSAFHYTYNPVFWYMYQLLILICISPVIYYLLKNVYVKYIFLIIFILIIAFGIDIKIVNEDAILYYYIGALISVLYNDKKIELIDKSKFKSTLLIFAVTVILFSVLKYSFKLFPNIYNVLILSVVLNRIAGVFLLFYFIDYFYDYTYVDDCMKINFFIYCTHYMVARVMIHISELIQKYINFLYLDLIIQIILFLMTPYVAIRFAMFLYEILNKYCPKYYKLLTGDR